jgi:uncharacterized protein (UPF0332 family)
MLTARRVRETADYGIFEEIDESAARTTVADGQSFIFEIERLLNDIKK